MRVRCMHTFALHSVCRTLVYLCSVVYHIVTDRAVSVRIFCRFLYKKLCAVLSNNSYQIFYNMISSSKIHAASFVQCTVLRHVEFFFNSSSGIMISQSYITCLLYKLWYHDVTVLYHFSSIQALVSWCHCMTSRFFNSSSRIMMSLSYTTFLLYKLSYQDILVFHCIIPLF